MRLSRESRYALIGLYVLGRRLEGSVVGAAELAAEADLPAPFMAKIFQRLTRGGLLLSHRGSQRGYSLARPIEKITVADVLEAIEGPDLFARCMFVSRTCDAGNPCPLHFVWEPIQEGTANRLRRLAVCDIDPTTIHA